MEGDSKEKNSQSPKPRHLTARKLKNMEQQERDLNKPIRFVILGTPYTIKPTEELTSEAITELVDYVKSLVESYLRRGFDETRVPLLVAFHIADEKASPSRRV